MPGNQPSVREHQGCPSTRSLIRVAWQRCRASFAADLNSTLSQKQFNSMTAMRDMEGSYWRSVFLSRRGPSKRKAGNSTVKFIDVVALKGKFPFVMKNNVLIGEEVPVENKDVHVGELVLNTLKSQPNFVAQMNVTTRKKITFQEIRNKSVKLALWMKSQGVRPGEKIMISSNHYAVIYVFLACLYIGAIPILWHENSSFVTAKAIIAYEGKMLFIDDILANTIFDDITIRRANGINFPEVIVFGLFTALIPYDDLESMLDSGYDQEMIDSFICEPLNEARKDIAAILCTRGLTNMSQFSLKKFVEIPHTLFTAAVNQQVFDMLPAGVGMLVGSFSSYINMIFAIQSILSFKLTIKFTGNWMRGVCQTISDYKVNWILLETNMCKDMAFPLYAFLRRYSSTHFSSLKMLIFSGSPMLYVTYSRLNQLLPNTSLISLYGTAETGIISCQIENGKFKSSGHVGKNVRLSILDLQYGQKLGPYMCGEISCICEGVTNKKYQEMIDIYGWYRTGDIGYYDEDGDIFVMERTSDYIFSKDLWYSPSIVENIISQNRAVQEVAVVAVRIINNSEHSVAFITEKPRKKVNAKRIIKKMRNKIDNRMIPAIVVLITEMPYEIDGTINRVGLRQLSFNTFYRLSQTLNDMDCIQIIHTYKVPNISF